MDLWDDPVERAKSPGRPGRANGTGSVRQEVSSSHDANETTSEIMTPQRSSVRVASAFWADTPPAFGPHRLPPHLRDEEKTPATSGARLLPPHLRDDGFETRVSSSIKSRAAADGPPSPATTPPGSENRLELDDFDDDALLGGKSPLVPDPEESRPIIRIRQVPLELSIQTFLSSIRLPNGRVMLADFVDAHRYVRLAFAEISAHNLFLECAFQGAWHPPWSNNPVLEITHGEVLPTSRAERTPGVTRVLQIHGLSPDQMKIDVLLRDMTTTAPRWPYCIEKVMLACAGRGDVARRKPFIQVNFASIRDALHARAALRNNRADSNIPYRGANFVFGHDDCSTTGAPLVLRSILDMRGGEYAEAGEEQISHGYVQIPTPASVSASATAQWQNAKAKEVMARVRFSPAPPLRLSPQPDITGPLASRATPAATAATAAKDAQSDMEMRRPGPMPVPPFDTVLHGIFVYQIPAATTEAQLLRVISGGMVRRTYIFRPGKNIAGTATHAAVFFGSQEVADRVAARILGQGGLMLSSTGRRYRTTPYRPPADFQSKVEDIPVHVTRVVSLTIEDSPSNAVITRDVVRSYIQEMSKIVVPPNEILVQKTMPLNAGPEIPSKLRTFTVKFTGVQAARRSIVALQRLNVAGKIRRIKYEHDPCDGPVELIQ